VLVLAYRFKDKAFHRLMAASVVLLIVATTGTFISTALRP